MPEAIKKAPKRPWTPGPWQEGRPDMASIVEGYESKFVRSMAPSHKLANVAIAYGSDVPDWDTIMANARLIAAAPDLFEALERLIGYIDSPCGGCGEWSVPPVEMAAAKAAITKALGVSE